MLGTALWYPTIDIDDPVFLRSAILFWEGLETIVPDTIETPYQNDDTRICAAAGYIKPARCSLHQQDIAALADEIMASNPFATRGDIPMFSDLRGYGMRARERSPIAEELGRLHLHKLDPRLVRYLLQVDTRQVDPAKLGNSRVEFVSGNALAALRRSYVDGYEEDESGAWIVVDGAFAQLYMTALAARFAETTGSLPLTNSPAAQARVFSQIHSPANAGMEKRGRTVLVGIAMRGLRVDASVPVERLLKFRADRHYQYDELAEQFTVLGRELSGLAGEEAKAEWLHLEAGRIYREKIQPRLRGLRRELSIQGVQSVWEGAYRALTIAAPAGSAIGYFAGLSGQMLLGAGAALAVTDAGVRGFLAARKAKAANPFSYLYDAQNAFGLPAFSDTD